MIGLAEKTMAPISYAAIAGIGIWLLLRGLRKLWRSKAPRQAAAGCGHDHSDHTQRFEHGGEAAQSSHEVCEDCGHRHGPSLEEVEDIQSWREAAVLIAGIAARPCTGALFVLIITWQKGIAMAGIAGAFAMALGTASVTIAVGLAALGLRGSALALFSGSGRVAQVVPLLEICAGFLIALIASGLLLRALG
jgi:ABC-type nickel/cobalt efflux system permease component RcnA